MSDELADLIRELPLPDEWDAPSIYHDEVQLGSYTLQRVGLSSKNREDVEVTGSAAGVGDPPFDRAYFELYERASTIEYLDSPCPTRNRMFEYTGKVSRASPAPLANQRRVPARSNGVAFHRTWEPACENAFLELAERDSVLASWYGQRGIRQCRSPKGLDAIDTHEWVSGFVEREYGELEVFVSIVVGFPKSDDIPLARGFGCARYPTKALHMAAEEAIQSLAFLRGEEVPQKSPSFVPSAMFHLDYYLVPRHRHIIRKWMDCTVGHGRPERTKEQDIRFVDLTPMKAPKGAFVVRAIAEDMHELVFGDPPEYALRYLREDRWIHPIA